MRTRLARVLLRLSRRLDPTLLRQDWRSPGTTTVPGAAVYVLENGVRT